MKKSDKKIENTLRETLTEVCEVALKELAGFRWITHLVNYSAFPKSLSIVCIFDTDKDLSNLRTSCGDDYLRKLIKERLAAVGIPIKDIQRQLSFDTEEACKKQHGGRWTERFSGRDNNESH